MLDLESVQQWPCVRTGVLPADVALKVASTYFEGSGNAKAKAYGLL